MRAMTVLERCREAKHDISRLRANLSRRQDAMRAFGGIRMDDIGGGRGTADDRMARMSAEIDEIERAIKARQEAYMAEVGSAMVLLDFLPELESDILNRYYVSGDSCQGIARAKRYDRSYVLRKKRDGEEIMDTLSAEMVAETLPEWYLKKWKEE